MSIFALAISSLTTSKLPWFMTRFLCNSFQIPMQFVLFSIRLYFHRQSHTQLVLFSLWLRLFIVYGIICPLFSSSILGTYQPGEFIFQCHIFLPFYAVHGVLKARILKWFAIPFSGGPCFVRTLHYGQVALHGMAHSFIELDKAVVHVIRLFSFLWLWFSFFLPSDK